MTPTVSNTNAFQVLRARNMLVQAVRTQLKGSGLDIRELETELAISSPGHPDYGRVYITYANHDVSHRRTIWDYIGRFDIQPGIPGDSDPSVDAHTIIAMLTSRAGTPS
jgi:hypothetical protein